MKAVLTGLGVGFGGLFVVVAALLALGAYAKNLPWVGLLGSAFTSLIPAWVMVLALVGGLLVWLSLHPTPSSGAARQVFGYGLPALAFLAVLGTGNVWLQMTGAASAHEVRLPPMAGFGLRGGPKGAPPDQTFVYTHDVGEDLHLSTFRPDGSPPAGGWPVLVYVHGGGWIGGSRTDRNADMHWFADQGWLVVSVDYALSSETRHLWDRAGPQVGCALAWIADNIGAHGGDIDRLALIGDSAGGALVINAGYMANAGTLAPSCGGTVPRVRAVSAMYPGSDPAALSKNTNIPTGAAVADMIRKYIGGTPEQYPNRIAYVTSRNHITPAAPPTLVYIAENDHLVSPASLNAFIKDAREGGVEVESVTVPFAEHGYDFLGTGNAIMRQTSLRFLNARVAGPKPALPARPQVR